MADPAAERAEELSGPAADGDTGAALVARGVTEPPWPSPDVPARLARRRPRVVVLGDAVLDGWISGHSSRLSREAPVPVVDVTGRSVTPGGAANTAAGLAALGAQTALVSLVGDDGDGRRLCSRLTELGVDVSATLAVPGRATVTKIRVTADEQMVARFDHTDREEPDDATVRRLGERLRAAVAGCDAVLVCDYGLGVLSGAVLADLEALRPALPLLVVDAHDCRRHARLRPDLMTPNAAEAAHLLGTPLPDAGPGRIRAVLAARPELLRRSGAARVAVTLDRDGALVVGADGPTLRTRTTPVADANACGAGDTFAAALTLATAAGLPPHTAPALAQAAADVVVASPGPVVCGTADLTAYLAERDDEDRAVVTAEELDAALAAHRAAGHRVVFTNGCFDVLHRAHVACLAEARRLGDVLVVAVNSDDSVRRLKGPGRPINPAADRAAVLAALASVDHVTVFDEDTPIELLRRLRPEVYVKGGDYTPEMLAETPVVRGYGGEVHIVGYVPDHSTTAVIERILSSAGTAPQEPVR